MILLIKIIDILHRCQIILFLILHQNFLMLRTTLIFLRLILFICCSFIFRKTLKVKDARVALEEVELEKRLSGMDLRREAVVLAEENGIVFIDEIDKLISNKSKHSGDASSEGVQRDLLPLMEGTSIDVR